MNQGSKPTSDEVASFLDRLADEMRTRGERILAEVGRIQDRVDERWLIDASETGQQEVRAAASRLEMPQADLVALLKILPYVSE